MPRVMLVPVRSPCWMPRFDDPYWETKPLTPLMLVADWIWVWWTNWPLTKKTGSRLGTAVPCNCTCKPLRTPPCPLPPPLLPKPPDPVWVPPRTPREAEDGPLVMLFETLRKREPALTRLRLASESLG